MLADVRACRACAGELAHEPRPVVLVKPETRLLICGQAQGVACTKAGCRSTTLPATACATGSAWIVAASSTATRA
jgi:hypothetical protein